MPKKHHPALVLCALAAIGGGITPIASAAELSDTALLIEVRSTDGSATMKVLFEDGKWDSKTERYSWDLSAPVVFKDPVTDTVIGTLKSCKLRVYGLDNLRINLDYAIEAGGSSTAFVVTPGMLYWELPPNWLCEGKTRASVYFADKNDDGVNIRAPGKSGQSMFLADYNGFVPSGTRFASLLGSIAGGPGASGTVTQTDPAFGYRAIRGDADDMTCMMRMLVSPGDVSEVSVRWNIHVYPGGRPLDGHRLPEQEELEGPPPP